MKVLVACEESQVVCIELRKLGHLAYFIIFLITIRYLVYSNLLSNMLYWYQDVKS